MCARARRNKLLVTARQRKGQVTGTYKGEHSVKTPKHELRLPVKNCSQPKVSICSLGKSRHKHMLTELMKAGGSQVRNGTPWGELMQPPSVTPRAPSPDDTAGTAGLLLSLLWKLDNVAFFFASL